MCQETKAFQFSLNTTVFNVWFHINRYLHLGKTKFNLPYHLHSAGIEEKGFMIFQGYHFEREIPTDF